MAASYVLDEINNSKVCTMGGNPINCTISNSGQYIQAYFNEGQVTGDIILQFTIGDVFYKNSITRHAKHIVFYPVFPFPKNVLILASIFYFPIS